MFVCEIPDKALIITQVQGHIGELLIYSFLFFFSYKGYYEYAELNSGKRGVTASRFMAKTALRLLNVSRQVFGFAPKYVTQTDICAQHMATQTDVALTYNEHNPRHIRIEMFIQLRCCFSAFRRLFIVQYFTLVSSLLLLIVHYGYQG